MAKRSGVLELAVLGLLQESPMHGYELRKRLHAVLGPFRALSYGSLYPALRDLVTRGYITETPTEGAPLGGKRARIVNEHGWVDTADCPQFVVRDGLAVIPKNAVVPDGWIPEPGRVKQA